MNQATSFGYPAVMRHQFTNEAHHGFSLPTSCCMKYGYGEHPCSLSGRCCCHCTWVTLALRAKRANSEITVFVIAVLLSTAYLHGCCAITMPRAISSTTRCLMINY